MSWPYFDDEAYEDREMWSALIASGRRQPTQLKQMPTQGKVIVAAECRWQAAVRIAAYAGLDYFLNDLIPRDMIVTVDLDDESRFD